MDEAIKLADKMIRRQNVLRYPANDFVREFIGQNRLIQDRPNMRTVEDAMIKPITIQATILLMMQSIL